LFGFGLSIIPAVLASLEKIMLASELGRRTQVVKGEVCKTSMQRFESARRLQFLPDLLSLNATLPKKHCNSCLELTYPFKYQSPQVPSGFYCEPTWSFLLLVICK
jgi:hypothetical protein